MTSNALPTEDFSVELPDDDALLVYRLEPEPNRPWYGWQCVLTKMDYSEGLDAIAWVRSGPGNNPPVLSFLLLPDKARRQEQATKMVSGLLHAFPGITAADGCSVLGDELNDLIDKLKGPGGRR